MYLPYVRVCTLPALDPSPLPLSVSNKDRVTQRGGSGNLRVHPLEGSGTGLIPSHLSD